jgi:hypothetical protein
MELFERWMRSETPLGASVSLVPFIKGSWQMNHYGDPKWNFIPSDAATVRGMIFQLQTNGPPGFLRPYMTDDGRDANISFFYRDHKGDTIHHGVKEAQEFITANPMGEVSVRLNKDKAPPGVGFFNVQNLIDWFYYFFDPLLPSRNHTLNVRVREGDGYKALPVNNVDEAPVPAWIDDFREAAIKDFEEEKSSVGEGEYFTWPAALADWDKTDVDQWWESEELGIRAIGLNTKDLIVQDIKSVDKIPEYQPTQSWTRGAQFVMAGGVMGILAAINDEVERAHVANISLIFLVIFILHSITYQSMASGGIIFLQIATATLLSLAYMAIKGIGLNINTLPVQSVGVGIGVDYAIYIVDRIRQEVAETSDIDEAVRRAIRTTGMAVSFTATTVVGGIILWSFSNLRFQAEMAQLLVILMIINMLGAITIVPTFYSILRPSVATALLTDEQREAMRYQKELEEKKGLA